MTSQGVRHGKDHVAGPGPGEQGGRRWPGGGARRRTAGLVSALALAFALVGTGAVPAVASPDAGAGVTSETGITPAAGFTPEAAELREWQDAPVPSSSADAAQRPESSDGGTTAGATTAGTAGMRLGFESVSVWNVARTGMNVTGWGFAAGGTVVVSINGSTMGELAADAAGGLAFNFTAEMPAGSYRIGLSQGQNTAEALLTVVADAQWYTTEADPYLYSDGRVFTQAQVSEAPPEYLVYDLAASAPVDILVNGVRVETQITNSVGKAEFVLTAPRSPGTYTVTFDHPTGGISATAVVVPNTPGTAPTAGHYGGSSLQTHRGGNRSDEPQTRGFSFQVSADGKLTAVTGEYFWVCIGPVDGSLLGSGTNDFADFPIPPTRITRDRPFEITWHDGDFTVFGTVHADGTASGDIRFNHGACGYSLLDWSTAHGAQPAGLTDVDRDDWFYGPVNWMVQREITTGYGDGTFRPNRPVNRGEAVTFLYRYVDEDFTAPSTQTLEDVPTTHNFFEAISWATSRGVVNGYTDNTFRSSRNMTRAEVAAVLYRQADPDYTAPDTSTLSDVVKGRTNFYEAISWMVEEEITTGRANGTFDPGAHVTRAEFATFLQRFHGVTG